MKISNFSKWEKWHRRDKLDGLKYPGVYALAISSKNLTGTPFSLIKNIVYFGMTNSINGLQGRLRQFDITIKAGKDRLHGGAERFRFKYTNYEELTKELYVSVNFIDCNVKSNKPADLYKMGEIVCFEYICLAEYVKKFDHLPKFNDKKNHQRSEHNKSINPTGNKPGRVLVQGGCPGGLFRTLART